MMIECDDVCVVCVCGQTCINQLDIGDSLKVLPINVMACKKMLVLCGPTYPQRLW